MHLKTVNMLWLRDNAHEILYSISGIVSYTLPHALTAESGVLKIHKSVLHSLHVLHPPTNAEPWQLTLNPCESQGFKVWIGFTLGLQLTMHRWWEILSSKQESSSLIATTWSRRRCVHQNPNTQNWHATMYIKLCIPSILHLKELWMQAPAGVHHQTASAPQDGGRGRPQW